MTHNIVSSRWIISKLGLPSASKSSQTGTSSRTMSISRGQTKVTNAWARLTDPRRRKASVARLCWDPSASPDCVSVSLAKIEEICLPVPSIGLLGFPLTPALSALLLPLRTCLNLVRVTFYRLRTTFGPCDPYQKSHMNHRPQESRAQTRMANWRTSHRWKSLSCSIQRV
jgi:hypothetical protein